MAKNGESGESQQYQSMAKCMAAAKNWQHNQAKMA